VRVKAKAKIELIFSGYAGRRQNFGARPACSLRPTPSLDFPDAIPGGIGAYGMRLAECDS